MTKIIMHSETLLILLVFQLSTTNLAFGMIPGLPDFSSITGSLPLIPRPAVPVQIPMVLLPVPLYTSGNYVLLSQSGISSTGTTVITGNLGLSPAASTAITGFDLIESTDGTSSTSALVTGSIYASNYASPTPRRLTQAVSDMVSAYNNAAGRRNPNFSNLNSGSLNGVTLRPGLYKWTTGVNIGGIVTISGSLMDVFIFQIAGTLDFNSGSQIKLSGGVLPQNVIWQVAGQVTLGSTCVVQGIILGKTAIVFDSEAKLLKGRALSQSAITLISNTITQDTTIIQSFINLITPPVAGGSGLTLLQQGLSYLF